MKILFEKSRYLAIILKISTLKQKKDELNIFISYGDMGVCRDIFGD